MDYSPPGSSVHGIFQARIPEWLPLPSPRNLQDPGIKPVSPALAGNDSLPLSHLIQINTVLHLQCFAVPREWSQSSSHLFSAVILWKTLKFSLYRYGSRCMVAKCPVRIRMKNIHRVLSTDKSKWYFERWLLSPTFPPIIKKHRESMVWGWKGKFNILASEIVN